jgi:hypothetical protein
MRLVMLLAISFLLMSCARWPSQPDGADVGTYPMVESRWDAASKKRLGSAQDEAEIRRVLHDAHPEMSVTELRWLSPTEAMAYTESGKNGPPGWMGYASYYCAFQKKKGQWRFIAYYLYMVS